MNLKYSFTSLDIRNINDNLAIETSGTKQCRIKNIRTVCCSNKYHAAVNLKSIHLDKHLIKRLLTFIMTTTKPSTALTSHSIDFINEYDTRRIAFCGIEKIPYT